MSNKKPDHALQRLRLSLSLLNRLRLCGHRTSLNRRMGASRDPTRGRITAARWSMVALGFTLLLAQFDACGAESLVSRPVPERVCAKLQAFFQKHYPKATFTNRNLEGVRFECEVTTFEFPYTGPPGGKHEATTQRGPKKGGVLCRVHLQKGSYQGQVALFPRGDGQFAPHLINRKQYKELLMAPYSPGQDAHLWVALSYPSDASEEFLKQFRAIMTDFEKDAG